MTLNNRQKNCQKNHNIFFTFVTICKTYFCSVTNHCTNYEIFCRSEEKVGSKKGKVRSWYWHNGCNLFVGLFLWVIICCSYTNFYYVTLENSEYTKCNIKGNQQLFILKRKYKIILKIIFPNVPLLYKIFPPPSPLLWYLHLLWQTPVPWVINMTL